MKRFILIGIFIALFAGIFVVAATWSKVTPVNPPVSPDTTSTPNPAPRAK